MGESNQVELFEKNRFGRLMKIQEDAFTRFKFEIWFEYTRQAIIGLKEGTFLAAMNFSSDDITTHYSILELTSIKPVHYALGSNPDGYPGFVMEAAKNIAFDWRSQENDSTEDTTIIQCIATPTEIELWESAEERKFVPDSSLPMIGAEVKIITNTVTEEIINKDIKKHDKTIIEAGKWLVDRNTPIYLDVEDFLRVHFGIFGFTKAGKSNLLSTFIAKLIESAEEKKLPIKIVIFDLMSEYTILLIDILHKIDNAFLVGIGEKTFPGSLIRLFQNKSISTDDPIEDLINTSVPPQDLLNYKPRFKPLIKDLIKNKKIRLLQPSKVLIRDYIKEIRDILQLNNPGNIRKQFYQFTDKIIEIDGDKEISEDLLIKIKNAADLIKNIPSSSTKKQKGDSQLTILSQHNDSKISENQYLEDIDFNQSNLTQTALNNLDSFKSEINKKISEIKKIKEYSSDSIITNFNLISDINDKGHSSLYIIQSHDPDELRKFAFNFGAELFENRRKNGRIDPLVSFIFDEADEFIPGDPPTDTHKLSVDIAHTIARRGRKFGIGIGIATQRTRYLNTSIMAQPHTYLVSKLPRKQDRIVVQEAFGFSDEIFTQTFKFTKGDWLLASYDATGLTGVPIPIHTDNANERIKAAIESYKQS